MSLIHPSSSVALLPQFSLWTVPPTQTSVKVGIEHEVRPISTYSSSTPIRFEVRSPANEYVSFSDSQFWIKVKFTLTHTTKTKLEQSDWTKVKFRKNLMHSLFRTVTLSINGKQIIQSPSLYAFKAYFETLLGYSENAKKTHLETSGYDVKPEDYFDSSHPNYIEFELIGPLHLDLAQQAKSLLGGTDFVIEMLPHDSRFYIECEADYSILSVDFVDTCLYVHRSLVSQEVVEAHNAAVMKAPTRYPFTRCEVRHMMVAAGQSDIILDNVVAGVLPRRMFLGMIDNKDFTGSKPYNFQHFNLNYIVCYRDGVQTPVKAYTPDFKHKHYSREYLAFFKALNQNVTDPIISMSRASWGESPLFGFNFAPDLSNGPSLESHVNIREAGHLRLHLKFSEALKQATVALMYLEFDSCLELDALRNVQVDY